METRKSAPANDKAKSVFFRCDGDVLSGPHFFPQALATSQKPPWAWILVYLYIFIMNTFSYVFQSHPVVSPPPSWKEPNWDFEEDAFR